MKKGVSVRELFWKVNNPEQFNQEKWGIRFGKKRIGNEQGAMKRGKPKECWVKQGETCTHDRRLVRVCQFPKVENLARLYPKW